MTYIPLTAAEAKVYAYMMGFFDQSMTVTVYQIRCALGLAQPTASNLVARLCDKNYVVRVDHGVYGKSVPKPVIVRLPSVREDSFVSPPSKARLMGGKA